VVDSCCGSDAARRREGGSVDAVDDPGEIVVEAEDAVNIVLVEQCDACRVGETQRLTVVPLNTVTASENTAGEMCRISNARGYSPRPRSQSLSRLAAVNEPSGLPAHDVQDVEQRGTAARDTPDAE